MLPVSAAEQLLASADTIFEEGTRISNPRILTSTAMAVGLLGGYIILFGGLRDLVNEGVRTWQRFLASTLGVALILLLLTNGSFDIYSVLVEFSQRGETLGQRFIEHFVFVAVSLIAGLFIGIALGLWAARDERMQDVILYTVGIIQTIPSLALFGVLLVPLSRLGDQLFTNVIQFFFVSLLLGVIVLGAVLFVQNRLPQRLRTVSIIIAALIMLVPFSLFNIIVISFGFEAILTIFVDSEFRILLQLILLSVLGIIGLMWLDRTLDEAHTVRWLLYARYALSAVIVLGSIYVIILGGQDVIGNNNFDELTIRDLGVSGIGTAPAIIALTLYSLLPLVRNTYTGLRNVDPAIIDSGRGMGLTPRQIFFQIELPLAFPIIMAGVRNAGISLVGIAAVASIIGAGALGDFILLGVNSTSIDLILLGAIPAIVLAVFLDALLQLTEALFTSPGIRRES